MTPRSGLLAAALAATYLPIASPVLAQDAAAKPNILVIMGDDVGYWNISAYNRGMMGYRTPNIDRIAEEGGLFTDYYAQQSCTAGRAAFITGQSPMRTGLLKVGLPGAPEGLRPEDPTIAELLKPLGYATGQFGKNHLGDRNEFLPTVHGFDAFFGNLYHLNAEEEPEHPDYPRGTVFRETFGPRGVMRCEAATEVTPGEDPRFGPWFCRDRIWRAQGLGNRHRHHHSFRVLAEHEGAQERLDLDERPGVGGTPRAVTARIAAAITFKDRLNRCSLPTSVFLH